MITRCILTFVECYRPTFYDILPEILIFLTFHLKIVYIDSPLDSVRIRCESEYPGCATQLATATSSTRLSEKRIGPCYKEAIRRVVIKYISTGGSFSVQADARVFVCLSGDSCKVVYCREKTSETWYIQEPRERSKGNQRRNIDTGNTEIEIESEIETCDRVNRVNYVSLRNENAHFIRVSFLSIYIRS